MMIYQPRHYQYDFFTAMESGIKRATLVWHRRAGKDLTAFAFLVKKAIQEVGVYYYVFPSLKQGRKIIWDGKTGSETDHEKFINFLIPKQWWWPSPEKGKNDTEMKIRLRHPDDPSKEGSIIQIVGTKGDEADSIVGTNPRGILFSEYSIQSPIVWEVMSPILAENGGWAVFVYTPRGHNHGETLYQNSITSSNWYTSLLTVDDTRRANGKPVITPEMIQQEREEGKREAFIQREYYCSFAGAADGTVYGEELALLEEENRMVHELYNPSLPVTLAWDIGRDMTAIGFFQGEGNSINLIDYVQDSNKALPYFARILNSKAIQHSYRYNGHVFPHDIKMTNWDKGNTRYRTAIELGLTPIIIAPKLLLDDGIDTTRSKFRGLRIDPDRCKPVIEALNAYSSETDDETIEIMSERVGPKWATHACDMLRTYCTARTLPSNETINTLPREVISGFDPFSARGNFIQSGY